MECTCLPYGNAYVNGFFGQCKMSYAAANYWSQEFGVPRVKSDVQGPTGIRAPRTHKRARQNKAGLKLNYKGFDEALAIS